MDIDPDVPRTYELKNRGEDLTQIGAYKLVLRRAVRSKRNNINNEIAEGGVTAIALLFRIDPSLFCL